jgi:hypothetical protein
MHHSLQIKLNMSARAYPDLQANILISATLLNIGQSGMLYEQVLEAHAGLMLCHQYHVQGQGLT